MNQKVGRRRPRPQDGTAYAAFLLELLNPADPWLFALRAPIHAPNSAILPNWGGWEMEAKMGCLYMAGGRW
jgi:hypothetical protein